MLAPQSSVHFIDEDSHLCPTAPLSLGSKAGSWLVTSGLRDQRSTSGSLDAPIINGIGHRADFS